MHMDIYINASMQEHTSQILNFENICYLVCISCKVVCVCVCIDSTLRLSSCPIELVVLKDLSVVDPPAISYSLLLPKIN